MQKWIYGRYMVWRWLRMDIDTMAVWGKQGFELVAIHGYGLRKEYVFKRAV